MRSVTESIKVGSQDMELYVSVPDGAGPFLRWSLHNMQGVLIRSSAR